MGSPVESGSERTTTTMISPALPVLLFVSSLFATALAAPTPQEVTVTPQDPTEGVEEPGLVLVVDSSGGSGPLGFGGFGRFPGFDPQQFAGFDDFPSRLPSSFGFEDDSTPEISIDLSDIFGRRPSEDGGRVPGIINTIFDALGGHLGVQIGVDGGEGTVSLHGGEGGPVAGDEEEQQSEEDAVDEEEEEEKEGEEEIPVIEGDFNVDQYDEEAELVPTDIDETTNDAVPADVDQSENE